MASEKACSALPESSGNCRLLAYGNSIRREQHMQSTRMHRQEGAQFASKSLEVHEGGRMAVALRSPRNIWR